MIGDRQEQIIETDAAAEWEERARRMEGEEARMRYAEITAEEHVDGTA